MIGIFVHSTRKEPYAELIVDGLKSIETRTRDMLGRFIGQRVQIIKTASGKAPVIIGEATIANGVYFSKWVLDGLRNSTKIPVGSKYDCAGDGKWCYLMRRPKRYETPIPLSQKTILHRTRTFAEMED